MGRRLKNECIDDSYSSRAFRCSQCGLIYYDPQPTLSALQNFYSRTDDAGYANLLKGWTPQVLDEGEKASCAVVLKEMEEAWAKGAGLGNDGIQLRFLEIGIGNAHLLAVGRDLLGWVVSGIEISHPLAEDARRSFGIEVAELDLSDASSSAPYLGEVDIILMSHALEHTRHPGRVIEKIAGMLRPGGIAAIQVPNGGSLQAQRGWRDWPWGNYPEHLYFFTKNAFEKSFARVGMRCESFDSRRYPGDEKAVLELLRRQVGYDPAMTLRPFERALQEGLLLPELRVVARKLH